MRSPYLSALFLTVAAGSGNAIEPANPNASQSARKVLKYLYDLPNRKDNRLISGHLAGGSTGPGVQDGGYRFRMSEINYLHEVSGQWVGLIGADYCVGWIDYPNPLESQMYYKDVNRGLIDYWNKGGLVAITHHQFDPRELYTDGGQAFFRQAKTRLDISLVYTPGTTEYDNFRVIMDRWAEGLQELEDHGVVVLWRPFNEATHDGKWWGVAPPESFKKLYRYTFDYMTRVKGLDNLLWVYDGHALKGVNAFTLSHYPGDEFVDVVGLTMNWDSGEPLQPTHPYPNKVFACVEFNVRTQLPGHTIQREYDYMKKLETVKTHLPYASYFMSWDRIWGPYGRGTPESVRQLYNDPWVANRGEIPWQKVDLKRR
ncbi:MAG: hypothetical protein HY820_43965 [Acidobacteria bacterium]|nr:hypothetical protein [Acidobacteriota bacterium]